VADFIPESVADFARNTQENAAFAAFGSPNNNGKRVPGPVSSIPRISYRNPDH